MTVVTGFHTGIMGGGRRPQGILARGAAD